jgi:integrase/recombinase XerD
MPTRFFESPVRIQELRDDLAGPSLEGFAHELCQAGYAKTTARRYIQAAEHLIDWIHWKGIAVATLNESFIEKFECHLHRYRCPRYSRTHLMHLNNVARLFLTYLRNVGVVTASVSGQTTQEPVLLTGFHQWMRQQRGTCDATLYHYNLSIRDLLKRVGDDPRGFAAQKLRQFVLERSQQCGWSAAKMCTQAVRMFLRFLIAEGKCPAGLDASIPTLAHWRLSSLPRYLQSEDVERVIASCNCATPVGRRDRAIVLLLARLALRAGDIVLLDLDDIDWGQAWIHVSGKGRRQTRLPLTQEIGDAIAAYLQDGRPPAGIDRLFIRSCAPFRALTSCAVSAIVTRAMRRAGVKCPGGGAAHVLRHSVATSMLRQGASLQEIAVILRHRSIQTTEIYAKVDVTALREIAQAWPEVELC